MYGQAEVVRNLESVLGKEFPVFSFTIPDNFCGKCAVVRLIAFNEEIDEGTFVINVYAPNIIRVFSGKEDKSTPDEETLDSICERVRSHLRDYWGKNYNCWLTGSTMFEERDLQMHYYSFRLTIQIE